MDIRPIRTDEDYKAALREIEQIGNVEPGNADFDRQDVLVTLVESYEAKNDALIPPDPIAAIEFALDRLGRNRRDLEPYLGSRARIEAVLSRRIPLPLLAVHRLSKLLEIPVTILVQPYTATRPAFSPTQSRWSRRTQADTVRLARKLMSNKH